MDFQMELQKQAYIDITAIAHKQAGLNLSPALKDLLAAGSIFAVPGMAVGGLYNAGRKYIGGNEDASVIDGMFLGGLASGLTGSGLYHLVNRM